MPKGKMEWVKDWAEATMIAANFYKNFFKATGESSAKLSTRRIHRFHGTVIATPHGNRYWVGCLASV